MSAMRTLALFVAATGIAKASAIIPTRNDDLPSLAPRGESPLYGQCGGKNWSGTTNCVAGAMCFAKEEYYHQCVPATPGTASSGTAPAPAAAPSTKQSGGGGGGSVKLYGQCGAGKGDWTGPTMCSEGTCQAIQEYYSQCLPSGSSGVAASDANATQKPTTPGVSGGGGGGGGGSVPLYGQCGAGKGDWSGPTVCASGTCQAIQEYYSQCLPGGSGGSSSAAAAPAAAPTAPAVAAPASGSSGSVPLYGQCGAGKGDWTGPTGCQSGTCQAIQEYYSQCLPGTASSGGGASGTAPAGPAQSLYGQCGGKDFKGPTTCPSGAECDKKDDGYSQCLPSGPKAGLYQQCGGETWSGPKICTVGSSCRQLNQWYSQCFPASKKRDTPAHSKRDFFQEIAKAIGLGGNATSANATSVDAIPINATSANFTGVVAPSIVAQSIIPAPSSLPPKATEVRMYGQCGGIGFKGPKKCPEGFVCMMQSSNAYYSQCLPGILPENDARADANAPVEQAVYAQCGGLGFKGSNVCAAGTVCTAEAGNIYFSQCLPNAQAAQVPVLAPAPPAMAAAASVPVQNGSSAPVSAPSPSAPVSLKRDDAPPAAVYSQCGGIGWTGSTVCEQGSICVAQPNNAFYSQCMPSLTETSKVDGVDVTTVVVPFWGQCGGQGWQGPTQCAKDSTCTSQTNNAFYAQCVPSFAVPARRGLIDGQTSLVFNGPKDGKSEGPAPSSHPKELEVAPEEVPSMGRAKLDDTIAVVPRPSIAASPTPSTTSASGPTQTLYGQCGGSGYEGRTNCGDSANCYPQDDFYSQCLPLTQQNYAQCGGDNYSGPTACTSGMCVELRRGYSQCQPSLRRRELIDTETSVVFNPAQDAAIPAPVPESSKSAPIDNAPAPSKKEETPAAASQLKAQAAPSSDGATQQIYGQCGGSGYSGPTKCEDGSKCYKQKNGNDYSQCLPIAQRAYGQCGGRAYSGPTVCEKGSRCSRIRLGYSQCIPTNKRRDDYIPSPNNLPATATAAPPSKGSDDGRYIVDASPDPPSDAPAPSDEAEMPVDAPVPQAAPAPIQASQPEVQAAQQVPAPQAQPQTVQQPPVVAPAPAPQVQAPAQVPAPQVQAPAQAPPAQAPAPQASAPQPQRPAYETEDTMIPYNPALDSLMKSVPSILGQTSKAYAACGGQGFQGNTICETGSKCYSQNAYYSQCLPLVVAMYQQCGGGSYFGSHECVAGAECRKLRPDYHQCLPPAAKARRAMEDPLKMLGGSFVKTQGMFGQCGGTGWGGPKLCQPGAKCVASGSFYSQCLPDDSMVGKLGGKLNGGIKPLPKVMLPDLAPKPATSMAAASAAAPAAGGAAPAAPAAAKPAR